jgi:NAD(P)-dependent dehydrogenase (short-subunit alcohol dehydrogenase family)
MTPPSNSVHAVVPRSLRPRRVLVLGATGTIGRATVRALAGRGHDVVCFVRPRAVVRGSLAPDDSLPRFRQVPVAMLDAIIGVLGAAGHIVPSLADKAELARIGRYYATESMLVLDPATGRYDADATPSTGTKTLFDFYARLVSGAVAPERGDHAVF